MASQVSNGTHVLVIPFPGSGHLLPLMDLTHQLACRGLTITILVTPKNLPSLDPLLSHHPSIQTLLLPFPPYPSLPAGVENMQDVPITYLPDIAAALSELYDPVLQWFETHPSPPVAIIPDLIICSWTQRLATNLGIKVIGYVAYNANSTISWRVVPKGLPEFYNDVNRSITKCWGLIFNSFTDFENEKLDIVKAEILKSERVWAVGPLLPIKSSQESAFERGGPSSVPIDYIMAWLDSCQIDKSVVYVGFGSQIALSKRQMEVLAKALEDSGVRFIWAVKDPMKGTQHGTEDQSVVPIGFEERVSGRGLVIRGWAPQVAILHHRAVGSYLTHCGWNSVLEGILEGVLLLAWPMQADHYFNAKLLVDHLGAAILVCEGLGTIPDPHKLTQILKESVKDECPERTQAIELQKKALDAIKEDGSSYKALDGLVEEISDLDMKEGQK